MIRTGLTAFEWLWMMLGVWFPGIQLPFERLSAFFQYRRPNAREPIFWNTPFNFWAKSKGLDKPVLPESEIQIITQGMSKDGGAWFPILVTITDRWFFKWIKDLLQKPENKKIRLMLNQNLIPDEKTGFNAYLTRSSKKGSKPGQHTHSQFR